jgi:hypothetical protein
MASSSGGPPKPTLTSPKANEAGGLDAATKAKNIQRESDRRLARAGFL